MDKPCLEKPKKERKQSILLYWECSSAGRVPAWLAEDSRFHPEYCIKLDVLLHACDLSSRKAETRGSEIQNHPWIPKELEASLG